MDYAKKSNITLHKMKVIGHCGIHKSVDFNQKSWPLVLDYDKIMLLNNILIIEGAWQKMMHTICKYADNTELVISDIIKRENGEEIIKVVFERPTENGFDTLIFELPSYKIVENDGNYTDEEIDIFKKVVEQGAAHFYEIASEGGLESA